MCTGLCYYFLQAEIRDPPRIFILKIYFEPCILRNTERIYIEPIGRVTYLSGIVFSRGLIMIQDKQNSAEHTWVGLSLLFSLSHFRGLLISRSPLALVRSPDHLSGIEIRWEMSWQLYISD